MLPTAATYFATEVEIHVDAAQPTAPPGDHQRRGVGSFRHRLRPRIRPAVGRFYGCRWRLLDRSQPRSTHVLELDHGTAQRRGSEKVRRAFGRRRSAAATLSTILGPPIGKLITRRWTRLRLKNVFVREKQMAKTKRRYSPSASKDVESEMRRYKRGTAKSGRGGKVKSRKQAIAIGLSKARKKGKNVPKKPPA